MQTQKAVCECNNMSEDKMVVAVQNDPFSFTEDWVAFTWFAVIAIGVLTGGSWIAFVFGWNLKRIFHPNYSCSQCKRTIPENQFRV